jgi:hypothetical protein
LVLVVCCVFYWGSILECCKMFELFVQWYFVFFFLLGCFFMWFED